MTKKFYSNKNRNIFIYLFISIFIILIAGLKLLGHDNDYSDYLYLVTSHDETKLATKEIAFRFIVFINQLLFSSNFTVFLFIFAVIGVSVKILALVKLSPLPILSIILYLLSYYWLHEYIQIRAGVATGIFLLATKDLSDGNTKHYFIKTILAIMFHWSSILLIPLYFIVRHIGIKLTALLPVVGVLLYLTGFDLYILLDYLVSIVGIDPALYRIYTNFNNQINVFNLISISYLLIFLSITIIIWKDKSHFSEYEITLYKIFSIGIFIFFLTSLLNAPVVAFRLLEYFNVVLLILLPYIAIKFKQKFVPISLIVIYFIIYGYFLFTYVFEFN
jgi:hypothetical protein